MDNQDSYQLYDFARFYDWAYQGYKTDVSFFISLAERHGSPILEVACGSGRIMIPLAEHGFQVAGIDLSEHMLGYARAKLADEVDSVRNNVSLTLADMRRFDLGRTFSAVFVPNASVFHLPNRESLLACASSWEERRKPQRRRGGSFANTEVLRTLLGSCR